MPTDEDQTSKTAEVYYAAVATATPASNSSGTERFLNPYTKPISEQGATAVTVVLIICFTLLAFALFGAMGWHFWRRHQARQEYRRHNALKKRITVVTPEVIQEDRNKAFDSLNGTLDVADVKDSDFKSPITPRFRQTHWHRQNTDGFIEMAA